MSYRNIADGKMERLYVQDAGNDKFILVYRPTHYTIGVLSKQEVLRYWKMDTEEFYASVTRNKWFRLPKNGNYDLMQAGVYDACEKSYVRVHSKFTDDFARRNKVDRLYEDVPFDFIEYLRSERRIVGGLVVQCEFDETQEFGVYGEQAEFAETFFERIYSFNGHTKVELYKHLCDLVDSGLFVECLRLLKKRGVTGITALKAMSKKEIAETFVHNMNRWRFG